MHRPGCAKALVNVTMSTFCSDTGADGQFTPVSARGALPHKHPAGAFRLLSNHTTRTVSSQQTRRKCCIITISSKNSGFFHTGGQNDANVVEGFCEVEGNVRLLCLDMKVE